jgi:MFS family permease
MLRTRYRAAIGGLPPVFWSLWWGVLVNRTASFVGGFLALFLVQAHGFGDAAAGRVMALYGLGSMLGSLSGGVLADRVGRRFTMLGSLGAGALTLFGIGFAQGAPLLAGLAFAQGVANGMYPPALNAAVADAVPPAERGRAFGLVYWASNVGFGVGFALAALVAPRSLAALFLLDGATTLAFALLVAARVPETRPTGAPEHAALSGLLRVAKDRVLLAFLGLQLVMLLVFTQWALVFPVDVAAHGVGRGGYAALMLMNCVGAVVLQPLVAPWLRRREPSRVLAVSALLIGGGFGLNALAGGLPVFAAGVALWTVGEVLGLPTASALSADLAPIALRGRYQGAYVMTWGAALTLSPLVSGELAERTGAGTVWLACLAAGLLSAAGHLLAAGSRRRRVAALAAEHVPAAG